MKIKIESDLHLEFIPEYKPKLDNIDVYILAGDVAEGLKSFKFCNELLQKYPNLRIVEVAGNHNYYRNNITKLTDRLLDLSNNTDRYHFLQNSSVVISGIKFIGSTMWTDFNKMNPRDIHEAWNGLNDYRYIRDYESYSKITPYRINKFHMDSVDYIFSTLEDSSEDSIVVTHHKPYLSSNRELCKAYEVDLSERFLKCNKPPKYWFYGHSHESKSHIVDYGFGEVKFISNQLGYPNEDTNFDENFIINI